MLISFVSIGFLFLSVKAETSFKCYECSRGDKTNQQELVKYFYNSNDPSLKRALNNNHKDCGSNITLDSKFVSECPVCEISYILHDPNLSVISACKSSDVDGGGISHKYMMYTCFDDFCNNYAKGQDNKLDNNGSNMLTVNLILFLSVITRLIW